MQCSAGADEPKAHLLLPTGAVRCGCRLQPPAGQPRTEAWLVASTGAASGRRKETCLLPFVTE